MGGGRRAKAPRREKRAGAAGLRAEEGVMRKVVEGVEEGVGG